MKIINQIDSYVFYDQDVEIVEVSVKESITAPEPVGWISKQLISFRSNNTQVKVELTGNFGTKNFRLDSNSFEEYNLYEFSKLFELDMEKDHVSGFICLKTKDYSSLNVIIEEKGNDMFIIIYNYNNGDGRQQAKLYTHGIWKVG